VIFMDVPSVSLVNKCHRVYEVSAKEYVENLFG
jgi:hypothetical protein